MIRLLLVTGHLLFSAIAWTVLVFTQRGGALAFTHFPDVDATGRDRQMGPLLDALVSAGGPLCEVTFVPLGGGLWRNYRLKRRLFVSYAALAVLGRVLGSRDRPARLLLRTLRPRVVFLIDESGSGQPLLRAARRLGIRTIAVQHGDFQPGNPQYYLPAGTTREPADVMCVWSEWFRARLLAISPIYTTDNTRVTGRLRYLAAGSGGGRREAGAPVRVLLLAEAGEDFAAATAPFEAALRAAPDVDLTVRAHPSAGVAERDLASDLQRCDVAVGRGSSALLEAVYHDRPVVVIGEGGRAAEGIGTTCVEPEELAGLCRNLAGSPPDATIRERIWGGAPHDPVRAVLEAAGCGAGIPDAKGPAGHRPP